MTSQTKAIIAAVLCALALLLVGRALWSSDNHGDIHSDDIAKRLTGVEGLRRSDKSSARQALINLARDPDGRVGFQAVKAMGENRDERTYEALLDICRDSQVTPNVRGAAFAALGHYEQTHFDTLTGPLLADEEPLVRAGAARGLSHKLKWDRPEGRVAIPDLYKALYDPDPLVRGWAITAICKMTITRFNFNATKPPKAQKEKLEFIEAYLKRNGYM